MEGGKEGKAILPICTFNQIMMIRLNNEVRAAAKKNIFPMKVPIRGGGGVKGFSAKKT